MHVNVMLNARKCNVERTEKLWVMARTLFDDCKHYLLNDRIGEVTCMMKIEFNSCVCIMTTQFLVSCRKWKFVK